MIEDDDGNLQIMLHKKPFETNSGFVPKRENRNFKRVLKIETLEDNKTVKNVEHIKIKTLAEIRAERMGKREKVKEEKEEAEVSSTTNKGDESLPSMDTVENDAQKITFDSLPLRRIKLQRNSPQLLENPTSSTGISVDFLASDSNRIHSDGEEKLLTRINLSPVECNDAMPYSYKKVEDNDLDDVLLLEEDDDGHDLSLEAEEDLLNDLDDDE